MNTSNDTFHNRNKNSIKECDTQANILLSDLQLAKLKDICANIDPFKDIDEETMNSLKEMGIKELDDPFRLTNHLLRILEENLNHRQKNEQTRRAPSRQH